MSVKVIDKGDIPNFLQNLQDHKKAEPESFFGIFGTSGCLLNCEALAAYEAQARSTTRKSSAESKKARRDAKYDRIQAASKSLEGWFLLDEIEGSAAAGCGSCSIIHQLILILFPDSHNTLSDLYEYSLTREFAVRRKPLQNEDSLEAIHLFQPSEGRGVQLLRFRTSEFLLDKEISIMRLRGWLQDCLQSHKSCFQSPSEQTDANRPGRLIDLAPLQQATSHGVRLVNTKSGQYYRYACMSHRWDAGVDRVKTTVQNLHEGHKFIEIEKLPKNLRDAIWISRQLDIEYLWIDSICIIQEGDGDKDKEIELAKMGHIYKGAYLTIAAVSSSTSDGGCLPTKVEHDQCFSILDPSKRPITIGARILDKRGRPGVSEYYSRYYPLYTRGWVFQERLLSSRFLECNYGELRLNCIESNRCECSSNLPPHGDRRRSVASHLRWQADLPTHLLRGIWQSVVINYMQNHLTKSSDILPALGGIAQAMSASLQDHYVAGMWKGMLSIDLLWHTKPTIKSKRPDARPHDTTAPSWSWASLSMGQPVSFSSIEPGRIRIGSIVTNWLLRGAIEEIRCKPKLEHFQFGKIAHSYLKINSLIYPWYLRRYCNSSNIHRRNRGRMELHIEVGGQQGPVCSAPVDRLRARNRRFHTYFDDPASLEPGIIGIPENTIDQCVDGPPSRCGFGRVYLLHALQQSGVHHMLDIFLVLKPIDPAVDQPKRYMRIGLMRISGNDADMSTWNEIIQEKIVPYQETFWLV